MRCQKPKRRTPAFSGRNAGQDKSQQRTRSMSHSPERHRIRGRSPAFTAIASAFENPSTRYLSTPPPAVKKLFPRSGGSSTGWLPSAEAVLVAGVRRRGEGLRWLRQRQRRSPGRRGELDSSELLAVAVLTDRAHGTRVRTTPKHPRNGIDEHALSQICGHRKTRKTRVLS